MRRNWIAIGLVLAAPAAAQTFTSPKGYDTVEASGSHSHVLGAVDGLRWQQVDATLKGAGYQNLSSIAWRRDGVEADNTAWGARTFQQLSVVLAHATLGSMSNDFGANYKDAPVVVFTPKDVSAPDWTQKPAAAPAPFNLRLSFDRAWSYNGQDDFLWEVVSQRVIPMPATLRSYGFDYQPVSGTFTQTAHGAALGTGCLVTGQSSRFVLSVTVENQGARLRLRHSVNFGPRNAPVFTFLDGADANQTVPGLCAPLRALPTVVLPLGGSSPTGSAASAYVTVVPYDPAILGRDLYLQAAGADGGQAGLPFAVSQARRVTLPARPALPVVGRVHSWLVGSTRVTYGPWPGGVVAQFQHQ
jgi:hypothetical protein